MREARVAKIIARGREAVDGLFDSGAQRAAQTGRPQWLSLRAPVAPCDALALFADCQAEDAFYWEEPARGLAIAGLGRLHAIESRGAHRVEEAARLSRELFADHQLVDLGAAVGEKKGADASAEKGSEEGAGQVQGWTGPLLVGGFSFSGEPGAGSGEWEAFGAGRLVLPERVYLRQGNDAWLSASGRIAKGDDPGREATRLRARFEETLKSVNLESVDLRDVNLRDVNGEATPASGAASTMGAPDKQACWRGFPPALGHAGAGESGPEYRVRSDRSHARYCAQVQAAREAIARGELEKVVLARSLHVSHDGDFDLPHFLDTLRRTYPSCAILALRRGGHYFVSASPERLVELAGDRVETVALAGTAPRGRSPEEDERIGRELRERKKDQEEHAIVRRAIEQALQPLCGELEGPETPVLLRLEGIQHLETPLAGRLAASLEDRPGVLDLVARLHPTPAVGGAPRAAGQAWIDRWEGLDRGWYAGPVGFVTARGDGSFRVALRSAHIRGGEARLFAGAGIVEASQPEDELRETRLKLRALLAPLTEI